MKRAKSKVMKTAFKKCVLLAFLHTTVLGQVFGSFPSNYKELVEQYFYDSLIDPKSMMLEFKSEPFKAECLATAIVTAESERFGYGVQVRINAKNKLGGYTGWKIMDVYIRNGKAYHAFEFDTVFGMGSSVKRIN